MSWQYPNWWLMYVFYSIWHLEHWVSTPWPVNSNILTQKPSTDVRIIFKPLIPHHGCWYITWMGCYLILNKPTYYRKETTVQKFMCMHYLELNCWLITFLGILNWFVNIVNLSRHFVTIHTWIVYFVSSQL